MKKQHFFNYHYQKLGLHQKLNLKHYFIKHLHFNYAISDFEFLCILDLKID